MSGLTHLRISSFLIYLFFSFHCFINNNIYFALANRRKQDERKGTDDRIWSLHRTTLQSKSV